MSLAVFGLMGDLVILSMGFLGPEERVLGGVVERDGRKNVKTTPGHYNTNLPSTISG